MSFNCTDALSGVATCTAPVNVQSEGANQSVSGSAADKAGNTVSTSATVNLDKTPPQITVSSPVNGATVSTSNLTVSGTVTDALSGLSAVTCNGTPASFSATDFQCGLSLVSGSNSILVQATDAAGNSALNTLSVTFGAVLDPPPTTVFVTPTKIAMLLSETRRLALVDELGRTIPATSWSVSDPALAMVGVDGTVTPLAAGEVIVTGTFQTLSAEAQLFVTPGETFEVGTVRWLVEPLPGNSIAKIFPGQAGTDTTSFMVETGSSGDVMRAFNQEGVQTWMYRITATTNSTSAAQALATNSGAAQTPILDASSLWWARGMRQKIRSWDESGSPQSFAGSASLASSAADGIAPGSEVSIEVLAVAVTDSGGTIMNQFVQGMSPSGFLVFQEEIIALDEGGRELWRNVVFQGDQWFAVHPDGTVFIVEPDLSALSWRVTAKDGTTGAQKFFVTLPRSGFFGGTAPIAGSPTVGPDGNFYLPFEKSGGSGTPDTLQVLRIKPDGSQTFTEIASVPHCGLFLISPREVIPVTDDKFLATYDFFPFDRSCLGSHSPAQAIQLSTASGNVQVTGRYPLGPLALTEELPSEPIFQDGDLVVGEDGVAFATDGQSVLAFDSETGSQRWLYQPPPFCANCFHGLRVDRALEGNQLLVKDIEKVGNEFGSVVTNLQVPLNSNGVPLSDPFAGYGPGSNTGIGALYPPSCYVSYIVSDPVSGLLTIIQPDFGGPNCGQGFGATIVSSSSTGFGPTPGLAKVVTTNMILKDAFDSFWARDGGQASGRDFLHPFVSFEPFSPQETLLGVPKGSPKKIKVILKPETSASPVELRLKTRTGTGLAQFDPSNLSFNILDPSALPISGFNFGTGNITLKGIIESSTADNIRLEAHPKWPLFGSDTSVSLGKLDLSVVSVNLSLRAGEGEEVSDDNAAKLVFTSETGQSTLGARLNDPDLACGVGVEIIGFVHPANYTGRVVLKRSLVSGRVHDGPTSQALTPRGDTSASSLRDDDPQSVGPFGSTGSAGRVYDLDFPQITFLSDPPRFLGHTVRVRLNFRQYAVLDGEGLDVVGNEAKASNDFSWFSRVSCLLDQNGPSIVRDIPGDNAAGIGSTALSSDLQ